MPPSPASAAPKPRQVELDFIRGIAILMVIDFHSPGHSLLLAPFLALGFTNFGWAGVDIFFVLSGFLVGGLLIKEWKTQGRIDARQFLIRRGFKIWPQYYVFLLLMLATRHRTLRSLWGNLLNIQNYTGGIAHTWTLAVEEHAYLLLVLILAVAARRSIRMRTLFFFLLALAAAVIVNCSLQARLGLHPYSHTDTRIDGIFFGVLLAMLYHYVPQRFRQLQALWPLWASVLLAALAVFRFAPDLPWAQPLLWFMADLSGVAALLLLYHHHPGRTRPAPYRFIAAIGLYSYGIYLWHVSVMGPVVQLSHHLPARVAPWFTSLGPYVLGILLGVVFTRLVEFPALKLRDRLFPRRVDSAVGIPAEVEAETGIPGERESVSAV